MFLGNMLSLSSVSVLLRQNQLSLEKSKLWKRSKHSYVPAIARDHFDSVVAAAPKLQTRLKDNGWMTIESETDIDSALGGFEKVLGIPASNVRDILRKAPTKDSFEKGKKDLLSWKTIERGNDLFIKGRGKFSIVEVYNELVKSRRSMWAMEAVFTIKAQPLRRAYKSLCQGSQKSRSASQETNSIDHIRMELAKTPEFNLLELFANENTNEILKQKGFCSEYPPFPLFVNSLIYSFRDHDRYIRSIDPDILASCIYTGATNSGFFWLPSVSELQVQAYFPYIDNSGTRESLTSLLAREESCRPRQHLIQHFDYWKQPDNVGSIDEIVRAEETWPADDEVSSDPRRLINFLRAQQQRQELGSEIIFEFLDDLPNRGRCKVLRTNYEVGEAAKRLRNCARSYIEDVDCRECILITLIDSAGKPIALAMYSLKFEVYEQIYEVSNKLPSDDTKHAFDEYLKTIQEWHGRAKSIAIPSNVDRSNHVIGKQGRNIKRFQEEAGIRCGFVEVQWNASQKSMVLCLRNFQWNSVPLANKERKLLRKAVGTFLHRIEQRIEFDRSHMTQRDCFPTASY